MNGLVKLMRLGEWGRVRVNGNDINGNHPSLFSSKLSNMKLGLINISHKARE